MFIEALEFINFMPCKMSLLHNAAKRFCQRQSLVDRGSVTYIENVGVYGRAF
jgi:hypothetical protein